VDGFSERAERYADYFDLDEEMFRATDRSLIAWTNLLDPEGRQPRLFTTRRAGLLPAHFGW